MRGGHIRLVEPDRVLGTRRLLLEPIKASHAAELFEPLRDYRLYAFIPQEPPASEAALRDRYGKLSSRRSPEGDEAWLNWAMRERDTGEYVGLLEATVQGDRIAFIAYIVFVPHQRKGFAAEGCRRLIRHLFEDYGAVVIVAEIDTRNAASIAIVEDLCFVRTALKKDADHFKGASSDEYRYELRGPEYPRC